MGVYSELMEECRIKKYRARLFDLNFNESDYIWIMRGDVYSSLSGEIICESRNGRCVETLMGIRVALTVSTDDSHYDIKLCKEVM